MVREQFLFLNIPEQLFLLKRGLENFIPLIPLSFDSADIERSVSYLKRKGHRYALVYDRGFGSLRKLIDNSDHADEFFLYDADAAVALRESGYEGKISLFSSFMSLSFPDFYREFKIRPVLFGEKNYKTAVKNGLNPIYFASRKRCIADFNTCVSRKGDLQNFHDCDMRCREKSFYANSVEYPFSIHPDMVAPEDAESVLVYSDRFVPDAVRKGEPIAAPLNRHWNYSYHIGSKIVKTGRKLQEKNFSFALNRSQQDIYNNSITGFWGYGQNIYRGDWVKAKRATLKDGKLTVQVSTAYEKLMLIEKYDKQTWEDVKKARHFINTMPHKPFLRDREDEPFFESAETPEKKKITVLTDETAKAKAFKQRDVERVALLYRTGQIRPSFNQFLYISGELSEDDISFISNLTRLKGVIVENSIHKILFERLFEGNVQILMHPLMIRQKTRAPIYITLRLPIFHSFFTSEKGRDYRWPNLGIEIKNRRDYAVFFSNKKVVIDGEKPEIWVNLVDANEKSISFIKRETDGLVRNRKGKSKKSR